MKEGGGHTMSSDLDSLWRRPSSGAYPEFMLAWNTQVALEDKHRPPTQRASSRVPSTEDACHACLTGKGSVTS